MSEFIEILNELPRDEQVIWNNFIEAANERYSETTVLFNTMSKIRHNVGFHYDQKGKVLRNAYISFFYGKNIDNRHVYAYYSIGKNLELSRFYFSDAVIQESMYIASGGKMKEINKNDESFKIYQQQVMETVKGMCSITEFSKIKSNSMSGIERPSVNCTLSYISLLTFKASSLMSTPANLARLFRFLKNGGMDSLSLKDFTPGQPTL